MSIIDKTINASIFKARFCSRLISRFDKEYKDIQIKAKRLKKIWKKERTKES